MYKTLSEQGVRVPVAAPGVPSLATVWPVFVNMLVPGRDVSVPATRQVRVKDSYNILGQGGAAGVWQVRELELFQCFVGKL